MRKVFLLLFCTALISITTNCNNNGDSGPSIIGAGNIKLNTKNVIPSVENRNETGVLELILYSDNYLEFSIVIDNLSSSDQLTEAYIYTGDPVSIGTPAITLVDGTSTIFQNNKVTGGRQLTDAEAAIITGDNVYVNVHSAEKPEGLVRGQIDKIIEQAYNVTLSPQNIIPEITDREDHGMAILRVVKNENGTSKLIYNVTVENLKPTDAITNGYIRIGNTTQNGNILVDLDLTDASQLGSTKELDLEPSVNTKLKNDALYINLHSTDYEDGLMRGQIR